MIDDMYMGMIITDKRDRKFIEIETDEFKMRNTVRQRE